MKTIFVLAGLLMIGAIAIVGTLATATPVAQAYNSMDCGEDDFVHWSGNSTTFDSAHGGFPGWWEAEIIYANGGWDADSVGADFTFVYDGSSSHDWTKRTNRRNPRIAETILVYSGSTCHLSDVDTWFNTRFSFDICTDCPDDTFDVRTVAIHEFGHWLVLEHISSWRPWDWDCVMWKAHGTDHTLCGHDEAGIIQIYGAD